MRWRESYFPNLAHFNLRRIDWSISLKFDLKASSSVFDLLNKCEIVSLISVHLSVASLRYVCLLFSSTLLLNTIRGVSLHKNSIQLQYMVSDIIFLYY